MPFDANLILAAADGDAYEWDYACLNSHGTPTLTTINDGGFTVLDIKETGAKGMVAILIIADTATGNVNGELVVQLQASDDSAFGGADTQTLAHFEVAGATHGHITAAETPCVVMRRFATEKRYVRIDAESVSGDNYKTVWCLLSPYPFVTL